MKYPKIPIIFLAAAMSTSTLVVADDDDDELELEEAFLYFELNDTDGDLGLHGKADGDAWKRMAIEGPEGPNERTILKIRARSALRRQGLTEIFFESSEPTFDELDPEVFFKRFPAGLYEWEGLTIDYEEIEGEVNLSHIIPAAPVVASVGGETDNPGFETEGEDEGDKICWEDVAMTSGGGVVIEWEPVMQSHFDKWSNGAEPLPGEEKIPLGVSGPLAGVVYYEFVAEVDETEYKTTAVVPPEVNSWTVPAEIIALAMAAEGEVKFEIIVRVETGDFEDEDGELVESSFGNQTAVEDCFEVEEP